MASVVGRPLNSTRLFSSFFSLSIWRHEASTKPKLRTYTQICDDENRKALGNVNLSSTQRCCIPITKLGIRPLQINGGRLKVKSLENGYCRVCQGDFLKDEFLFLMNCDRLRECRTDLYMEQHNKTDINLYGQVLKDVLSNQKSKYFPDSWRTCGKHVEAFYMVVG